MKAIRFILLLIGITSDQCIWAQQPTVEILTSGNKISLRGLSVVSDNVVWVSGSAGTVGKSSNGGKNWKWMTVKGYEKKEFRDIEAFDGSTALIMAVDTPATILKTTDGGETWKLTYENKTTGMFLDAMDFAGDQYGIVIGDPIAGQIFIAETFDGGDSWKELRLEGKRPVADSGEAFFAASGTNIRLLGNKEFYAASGGKKSRLIQRFEASPLPMIQGKETTGANSIDVYDKGNGKGSKQIVIVGGDFNADTSSEKNCFISTDGGKTWKAPKEPPHGYRSCVEFLSKDDLLTCGLTGVDYSFNGGKTWQWVSKESFHTCRIAKQGSAIFLAGNNGKIGRVVWK
ncbi:MAG: YCF48-related protein [Bacteroidota bacterium]|nr:YCF48-related protein [Bacteroidota bacterium]